MSTTGRYNDRLPPAVDAEVLPLVLVGLPGAGKTTVARLLAHALGVQVTDTDAEVRRRSRMTIPEIFASEGEERFRDREHRAVRAVLDSPAAAHGVVALGGGAVVRKENRELLKGRVVVYLEATPLTAAVHVGDGSGRPLMTTGDEAPGGAGTLPARIGAVPEQGTSSPGAADTAVGQDPQDAKQDGGGGSHDPVLERMEALYAQRAALYEEVASITVPTDGLSAEQVAALVLVALGARPHRVAGALAPVAPGSGDVTGSARAGAQYEEPPVPEAVGLRRIGVRGPHAYEVLVGRGLQDQLQAAVRQVAGGGRGGVAVVHDEHLGAVAATYEAELGRAGLRTTRIRVPAGEEAKTAKVLEKVWHDLGVFRMGRDGVVVGLGGGAVTDLAGFAAASWLRGVPVVQVPTSLLAMVDAAVGGKTGINTAAGKNLVGAFHPPSVVLADTQTLASLPGAELRAGLGEVVKCGLIADPVILERLLEDPQACTRWDSPVLAELVARSVSVKAAVVSEDLTESGQREVLNYGHTYAHAVERATGYTWRHGEAVAVGCLFAAHTAHLAGRLDAETLAVHYRVLSAVGLPTSFPQGHGRWEELHEIMLSDKKVRGGVLRMVLLERVAAPVRTTAPGEPVLRLAHEAVTAGGHGAAR
ncbi:3-dehydroquinate synthase [Actinomyces lilanjuaniae]|uniref:3-dehydroquinate synthase n=1 Tax=Actinomyces lilanjuaniae TaxID=2321394 RepID=UPI001FA9B7BB|nr:3-dehydroquinate synthase [Actinomyces lilanjuaniae]